MEEKQPPADGGEVVRGAPVRRPRVSALAPKPAVSRPAVAQPPAKPKRKPAPPPAFSKELKIEMKRLGYAVTPANVDIFKIAALQVVQTKLAEVATLLRIVEPNGAAPVIPASRPAAHAMTLENIDAMVNRLDASAAAVPKGPTANPCQWCGRPGVYKNNKGMVVCQGHLPMARDDDANDVLRKRMAGAFGGDQEVIRVDAAAIQRMEASGSAE